MKRKTGRKHIPHRTATGQTIDGLYRYPDGSGRWKDVETGERWTEHDERLAVLEYHRRRAKRDGKHADFFVPISSSESAQLVKRHGGSTPGNVLVIEQSPTVHRIENKRGENASSILKRIPDELLFVWMRDQILSRPKICAEQTGIEQLSYLTDLEKPVASPTLDEVWRLWFDKAKSTPHWKSKCRNYWIEFQSCVGVATLREVTQEKIAEYKARVLKPNATHTYTHHRFGAIKTIVGYSKKWGRWATDRVKVLAYCSILTSDSSPTLDPTSISRTDFHRLLEVADDQLKAVLLTALNMCMYPKEVADLRWSDFNFEDGTMVSNRVKTSVPRVGVLWKRTADALQKLPCLTDAIFLTDATKQPHNANTLRKCFRSLRIAANIPAEVEFSHIRDGAFTVVCEECNSDEAEIIAGHRLKGSKDHYLKRRPKIVTDACFAIEKHYFG